MAARWLTDLSNQVDQEQIQPIFAERGAGDKEYLASIARTKRFLERWSADPAFRQQVQGDPQGLCAKHRLEVDPDEIRLLWDHQALAHHPKGSLAPLAVRRYEAFVLDKLKYRDVVRNTQVQDSRFNLWRRRQMTRVVSELGLIKAHGIVHAPVCFELSRGCSVGCWFCGVSAPRLDDIFPYTPKHAVLWRETLEAIRDIVGPAAANGFCYWATDPLDNPDYEKFLVDFHEVLGEFPQTTTAIPLRDPPRIRRLLDLSRERGGRLDRFSILTLGILSRVHAEYSAEELTFVELVTQNKGAIGRKAFAGRARVHRRSQDKENFNSEEDSPSGTIACVSGFLFNMVDCTVRLISPCNADDRWPMGYRVYAQGTFKDGASLRRLLERMIADQMPVGLSHDQKIRFQKHLAFTPAENGFEVASAMAKQRFTTLPLVRELGAAIAGADRTAGEIALLFSEQHDAPLTDTFHALNQLFAQGVLDDEPVASKPR